MKKLPDPPVLDLASDQPIVLVDIDGVINVFQCRTAQHVHVAPYLPTLALLPDTHAAIQMLDQHIRIVWCSSWDRMVNLDLAPFLGISPKPWITPSATEAGDRHWKALAVKRMFANWHGMIAWIEDGFTPMARQWARDRLAHGDPTWLIDVTDGGLTNPIAHAIVEWSKGRQSDEG